MRVNIQKIANFCRLIDENGLLSLTNLAVIVVLVRVVFASTLSVGELASLLAVLGGYHFKYYRRVQPQKKEPQIDLRAVIEEIRNDVGRLKIATGFNRNADS